MADNFIFISVLKALSVNEGKRSGHVSTMGESTLLIVDITVLALVLISFFDEAKVDKTNNLI